MLFLISMHPKTSRASCKSKISRLRASPVYTKGIRAQKKKTNRDKTKNEKQTVHWNNKNWPELKLKCNAKTTLRHPIVWNRCGTMPKFQWKTRLTFRDIYVQSWQNRSFPIIFRKHIQGLAPCCDVTHDTLNDFSSTSILLFSSRLHKNVCLWEQSDF